MKNNYYNPKQIKPNMVMKIKLYPRESGKTNYEFLKLKKEFDKKKGGKKMKFYVLFNSSDGFIIEEVNGTTAKFNNSLFIYKRDNVYYLVDKNTGLSVARSTRKYALEEIFNCKIIEYESLIQTDAYQIKKQRFEKMLLVHNYERNRKDAKS